MRDIDLFRAFGGIDEEFVLEAEPGKGTKRRAKAALPWTRTAGVAAAACLCIACTAALMLTLPSQRTEPGVEPPPTEITPVGTDENTEPGSVTDIPGTEKPPDMTDTAEPGDRSDDETRTPDTSGVDTQVGTVDTRHGGEPGRPVESTDERVTDTPPVEPGTDVPVTDAPVTDVPVTDAPVTDPPVTEPPDTEPPVTDAPEEPEKPSPVRIGVVDSGINSRGGLAADIEDGYDFVSDTPEGTTDTLGHGTAVAKVIGEESGEANVSLVPMKVLDDGPAATYWESILALAWAEKNGVDIINLGLSYPVRTNSLLDAVKRFPGLVICAAGDNGTDTDLYPMYPSGFSLANVLTVAACDENGALCRISNYGARTVDIAAPGYYEFSSESVGRIKVISGSTYAAASVTGTAAILRSYHPGMDALDIKHAILSGADKNPALDGLVRSGGVLNTEKAIATVLPDGKIKNYKTVIRADSAPGFSSCELTVKYDPEVMKYASHHVGDIVPASAAVYESHLRTDPELRINIIGSEALRDSGGIVTVRFDSVFREDGTDIPSLSGASFSLPDGTAVSAAHSCFTVLMGDVDGDGDIDGDDIALCTADCALTPEQIISADANEDGKVNDADAAILRDYVGGTRRSILS